MWTDKEREKDKQHWRVRWVAGGEEEGRWGGGGVDGKSERAREMRGQV